MECPACHTPNADAARFCAKCGALLPAAPTEEDPLIGTVLGGRFRISGVLGEGGMGRVYSGEQQMGTSVRKVAVKMLLAQFAKDPQVVARFMRECGTVSELEHPNTIKVYDFGPTPDNDLYIAMELLSGASLEKVLEGGALPPERVDRILSQVCGSLQEAHDKGIVHRDLKPANIYLTTRAGEEDYVKVLDFGIAKRDEKHAKDEAKLTQQGTVLGTPPYMSPEQFRGQELDARSDIYSLGVMAYEMLTGRLPFDADTPWAWATQHMTAQPFPFETVPIGSAVPSKMKAAVMRALSKDKAQRPQSVREFFDEFTMGGGGRTSTAFGSRSSMPEVAAGGAMVTQPGIPGTMGAPLGAAPSSAPKPPGYGSGPNASVPEHAPSNPGLVPVVGMYPSSPGMAVPAGGYRAAEAPPSPVAARRGSAAPILGALAVLAVVGIVGGALYFKRHGSSTKESADAGSPATAAPVDAGAVAAAAPSAEDDAGASASVPSAAGPAHPAVMPLLPPKPTADPHAEQACRQAEMAANRDNLPEARVHYARCEGPDKVVARAAIEQAEIRQRRPPPPPLPPPPRCRGRNCPR